MSETAIFIDMLKTVEFVSCFAFVFGSVVSLSILTFSVLHFKKRLKQFEADFDLELSRRSNIDDNEQIDKQ